jgi:hypothetical protein
MWNMKCFVIPVIIGATGIVSKGLKISGNNIRKAFNRFSTKDSHSRNIKHYKESATIRNLKPEWWGSPFVQEEKVPGKTREKRNNNINKPNKNHRPSYTEAWPWGWICNWNLQKKKKGGVSKIFC